MKDTGIVTCIGSTTSIQRFLGYFSSTVNEFSLTYYCTKFSLDFVALEHIDEDTASGGRGGEISFNLTPAATLY
jgi:hypothetical protein